MSDSLTLDLEQNSPWADLCIVDLIKKYAQKNPESLAIIASNRTPLTYIRLYNHIEDIVTKLNSLGVGHNDRVAIALPNGPEMAVAFLSIAAAATCAPLNPAYRADEFEFYLSDLKAKALIVHSGIDSPARAVAQNQGIPIFELSPVWEAEAGIFNLTGNMSSPNPILSGLAKPDDVALVVHTSGTTSRPKIVPLSHTNLCTSAKNIRVALNLVEGDRCLNILPLFHTYGLITVVLSSLSAGGSVVCTSGFDASSFFSWLLAFQPTWYAAVPTMHQEVLTHTPANRDKISQHPLRFIASGTAALPQQLIRQLEATFQAPVIEHYGMTEASRIASNPLPPGERKPGSVGLAAGTQIAIMDKLGNLLPPGEVGEVVIQGENITQGYENNPEANAKAFTNGWFRTGDLGYLDKQGYLFLKGRLKEIINRGGEKISPIEVDEVLMKLPGILQAVTFAVPHPTLGEDVAAAVVLREGTQLEEQTIRRFLFERIADFKVPSQVVIVDALPKGATGKLQRIGLAEKLAGYLKQEYIGPRNEMEHEIADIFAQVLKIEKISVFDNFFALGGDSLRATQVASRINAIFNIELVNVMLFQKPTVAFLAEEITQMTKLAQKNSIEKTLKDKLPLSFAQARLWFLDQLEPNSAAYNIHAAHRLRGVLKITAIEESLREITRRHSVLRTSFPSPDGHPFQVISSETTLTLPVIDLSALPAQEREAQAQRLATQEAQQSFNLATGPLFRVKLLCLSSVDHVLLLTMHHSVSDGWSMRLFWQELTTLYEAFSTGNPSPLPELPIQYADYADWQRNWMQGEVLESHLNYWKQQLGDQLPVLELPTDRKRLPIQTYRGTFQSWKLSKYLTEALKTLSQQSSATLFMTLLAAFKTLLYRYTQQEDIIVGSPIAGRNRLETEGLIGFFVNTLVLRTDLGGNPSFRELLGRVRSVALGAYAHQDLPFEQLVEELRPERNMSHTPLFQVMLALQNVPQGKLELPELTLTPLEIDNSTAKFDLSLALWETETGLEGRWEYNADLFDGATIGRMIGNFETLLEGIVAHPERAVGELPLLTPRERHQLLVSWNDTTREYPLDKCIHQLFEEQVERTPEHIAVLFGNRKLTYREVNQKANQLAHLLKDQGVKKGKYVPVLMERSLELLLSHLAIMKAGAAFVPIDPKWPVTRIREIFNQLNTEIFLVNSSQADWEDLSNWSRVVVNELELTEFKSDLNLSTSCTEPIYVIFTSGSTGKPKGAINQHRGITNRFLNMNDRYGCQENDVILCTSNHVFDSSVWQLFWPLINGNCTAIVPPDFSFELHKIIELIEKFKVTITDFVPSVLNLLVVLLERNPQLRHQLHSLRQLIIGGEAMNVKAIYQFKSYFPNVGITNAYGPTETSIGVIFYEVPSVCTASMFTAEIPIGRPLFNVHALILDRHLNLVPIGVPGELYIGGVCVGLGYLNDEEKTRCVFIPNPFSEINSARLYKTGDLVRYLPDGNIEFLDRIDRQVKIRGIRIELGEVEATLAQHPDLREAVVIVKEDTPGDKRLFAYVVANESQPTIAQLRSFIKSKLPDYMVPSAFVVLEAIPLTPNGKIDRRALPSPDFSTQAAGRIAPCTNTELQLVQIWSEVLNIPAVGVRDNFFDLGGHSLLAVRLMARIEQQLGTHLALATLFTEPTIEHQASLLSAVTNPQFSSPLVPIRQTGSLLPFFCVHPVGGNVLCYAALARQLSVEQPFYGLQAVGLNGEEEPLTRIEDMATNYIKAIQTVQPQGSYQLGGWSFGGIVAFEIAQQLRSLGHEVAVLALIDSFNPTVLNNPKPDEAMLVTSFAKNLSRIFDKELQMSVDELRQLGLKEQLNYLLKEAKIIQILPPEIALEQMCQLFAIFQANSQAIHNYVPQPYSGQITLFCAEEKSIQLAEKQIQGWSSLAMAGIDINKIPGDHFSIVRSQVLVKKLKACLSQ